MPISDRLAIRIIEIIAVRVTHFGRVPATAAPCRNTIWHSAGDHSDCHAPDRPSMFDCTFTGFVGRQNSIVASEASREHADGAGRRRAGAR